MTSPPNRTGSASSRRSASRPTRLDGLVNNAGRMLTKPFLRTSVAELRTLHAINVESIWIGTQTAYPLLEAAARASGGASVVNISSVFGQVAAVAQSAYSATKGAITVLTKSVAEFARTGSNVRVNSVHPGPGNTPLLANGLKELLQEGLTGSAEEAAAFVRGLMPNSSLTEPEDVAGTVLFLVSDLPQRHRRRVRRRWRLHRGVSKSWKNSTR
ncbi:SDR family oxidoreductase [Achromobacter xylosoxidans]